MFLKKCKRKCEEIIKRRKGFAKRARKRVVYMR